MFILLTRHYGLRKNIIINTDHIIEVEPTTRSISLIYNDPRTFTIQGATTITLRGGDVLYAEASRPRKSTVRESVEEIMLIIDSNTPVKHTENTITDKRKKIVEDNCDERNYIELSNNKCTIKKNHELVGTIEIDKEARTFLVTDTSDMKRKFTELKDLEAAYNIVDYIRIYEE